MLKGAVDELRKIEFDLQLRLVQSSSSPTGGRFSIELDEAFLKGRIRGLLDAIRVLERLDRVAILRPAAGSEEGAAGKSAQA